jgi:hypothetical protein
MSEKDITVSILLKIISDGGLSLREKESVARCILRAQVNRTSNQLDFKRLTPDEYATLEQLIARTPVTT